MHADAKRPPFRDGSFPIVISNSIVHYIAEPAGALAEAVRVLVEQFRFAGESVAMTSDRHWTWVA